MHPLAAPISTRHARRFVLFAFLLALPLLVYGIFSPEIDLLGRPLRVSDQRQPADVIIAVSAGLLNNCQAHPNLFLREAHAAMLLRTGYSRSQRLMISGVYSRPPYSEKACHQKMARLLGVPPEALILDNTARTTLDNAQHSQKIMARYGWKSALLVTSRSHMPRALRTFQKQGVKAYPVSILDWPPLQGNAVDRNRLSHLKRFLYEYGALFKYQWYGYL